jgi:hypothetical protein
MVGLIKLQKQWLDGSIHQERGSGTENSNKINYNLVEEAQQGKNLLISFQFCYFISFLRSLTFS